MHERDVSHKRYYEEIRNKLYNDKYNLGGRLSGALSKTIDYIRLNTSLETIEASIDCENVASVKLAEKVGFELREKVEDKLLYYIDIK